MTESTPPKATLPAEVDGWCRDVLVETGNQIKRIEALRVEASHRQFFRLHSEHNSFVLMLSPPTLERNEQFQALSAFFSAAGIPVPIVVSSQAKLGAFLLNDLGRTALEDLYGSDAQDHAIHSALDLLHDFNQLAGPLIEPYTEARFRDELALFNDWFLAGLLAQDPQHDDYADDYAMLVAATQAQPQGCVHRDYHCRNVLLNEGQLGIVDFQDALAGPILYDVASLLEDCYYPFDASTITRYLNYFVSAEPKLADLAPETLRHWFDLTATQRQLKAIGIFARLHLRDNKASHLSHIAPVLARCVDRCRRYPALAGLSQRLLSAAQAWSEVSA